MVKQKSQKQIAIFEGKKIRRIWDDAKELWYFSVIDVVASLTDSINPRDYWFKMKVRVKSEDGIELSTICRQLKLKAPDGKMRETDCANTEGIFRIIQSIPSSKAEPFKLWLARVGYERIEETEDPEKAIQRALATYLKKGYSKEWVDLRLKSIEIRKDLTNEWDIRGVKKSDEFAILTDDISFAWAGLKTKDYKKHKDLKRKLGFPDDLEFKFNKSSKETRESFLRVVNSFDFKVRSIVFDKTKIKSTELKNNKNSFYSYAIKMVLKHSRNFIIQAKVKIDGSGDRVFRKNFLIYLRRELSTAEKPILKHCKIVDSKGNVLIQMADMVAGTIRRSYDDSRCNAKIYKAIIKKHIQDEWQFR